jgi:hypothetical protein
MTRTEATRFDSWKEIADYLKCDVRTARRWEKRGLPVHRVPGGERSAVHAFQTEIDNWLANSPVRASVADDGSRPPPASQPVPVPAKFHFGTREFLLVVVTFLFIALSVETVWLLRRTSSDRAAFRAVSSEEAQGIALSGSSLTLSDPPHDSPYIRSVTPIFPAARQRIVIAGHDLGLHVPFARTDCSYLSVRDTTTRWAAGRLVPHNWDEVMLDVESWTDDEIVISGFSGSYGQSGWELVPGDEVEIAVWNPQTGQGPAKYHLTVSAPHN